MNDEQLVHQYHYTFFPNSTFTQTPGAAFVFRYRPHSSDPNRCYYDFFILVRRHIPSTVCKRAGPGRLQHGDHAGGCEVGQLQGHAVV